MSIFKSLDAKLSPGLVAEDQDPPTILSNSGSADEMTSAKSLTFSQSSIWFLGFSGCSDEGVSGATT